MPYPTFFNLPEHKQNLIMDAIIDELSSRSYEAFNISNIIRKTSISRGSFYQYFKDKDDVYDYFYTYIAKLKYAYYGKLFDPSYDISLIERFSQIYEEGLKFGQAYPKLIAVAKQLMTSPHFIQDPNYQKGIVQALDLYESFFIADIKKGRIRPDIDTRVCAEMMMAIFNHLTVDKIIMHTYDTKDIKYMVKEILSIIEKGVIKHV